MLCASCCTYLKNRYNFVKFFFFFFFFLAVWLFPFLKNRCKFLFFDNTKKLYTTRRTHTRTLAGSKTMSGSLPYMSPRVGGSVLAGIAVVVAVSWT